MEEPASAFGRSAKVRNPTSVSPCSSSAVSASSALGRAGGHGHHPGPFGEQCLQGRPGAVGDVHAPVQHHLGGALGDQERLAGRVLDQHRGQLPLVVEGKDAQPLVAGRRWRRPASGAAPGADHRAWSNAFPPTGPSVGDRRFVAHQPEQQRAIARLPVGVECPLEGDHPFGEGARLVGEEDLDVAQVLDGDQPLHQHLLRREGLRAGGEAHRHDGRHHLGGDAHGDGQREEQRLDEGPGQRHVDDEDERRQHGRHREQEARETRQAHLEGGLALLLGQARGDLPEGGAGSGPDHHAERPTPGGRSSP